MGGLGNQLFQFAAGLNARKFHSKNPKFSLQGLTVAKNTPRSYMLGDLLKRDEVSRRGRPYMAIVRMLSVINPVFWVSEKDSSDFPLIRITNKSRVLLGYFQRFTYVDAVAQELIAAMSNSTIFSDIFSDTQQNNIAVHIRFGDYLTNEGARRFHGLSSMSYYIEAVKLLQTKHVYDKILIFSDDPNRATAEFTNAYGSGNLPVLSGSGISEYEDLAKISSCRGIVISNSTFSWWAAWLGSQIHDCSVVAPRPWFAQSTDADKNLLPISWTVINRDLRN